MSHLGPDVLVFVTSIKLLRVRIEERAWWVVLIMRIVHWLFVVGVALFISGIGFMIVGARTVRRAPSVERREAAGIPVATVKQIMNGIVGPAATVIFDSVSFTVTASGTEERVPHSQDDWDRVGSSAAALIESGNLLLMGNRAVDQGDWVKMTQAMIDAGKVALKATESKNTEALFASGEPVTVSCDTCHQKYQRGF